MTTTYVSNNVNEYTLSTTNGVTTTYAYDNNGNLISQTTGASTTSYTYNQLNELTGVNSATTTASYAYDPLGNLISQTVNGATTNYQVDPNGNIVAAFDGTGVYNNGNGLLSHYTYGLGLVSQVSAAIAAGYYDFNNIGSTIGITNAAGSYANRYSYLPFGQTQVMSAALATPFTFVGQYGVLGDGIGFDLMKARSYNPATGDFISNDPFGLAGGDANTRRYTVNNATASMDPSGLETIHVSSDEWDAEVDRKMDDLWNHFFPFTGHDPYPSNLSVFPPRIRIGYLAAGEFDSKYWNHNTYIFDGGPFKGRTMVGYEANYYFQGMIARAYGLSLPQLYQVIFAWKTGNIINSRINGGEPYQEPSQNEIDAATAGYDLFYNDLFNYVEARHIQESCRRSHVSR